MVALKSREARFRLGMVVATPGALDALAESKQSATTFLERHVVGDWGDVDHDDWQATHWSKTSDSCRATRRSRERRFGSSRKPTAVRRLCFYPKSIDKRTTAANTNHSPPSSPFEGVVTDFVIGQFQLSSANSCSSPTPVDECRTPVSFIVVRFHELPHRGAKDFCKRESSKKSPPLQSVCWWGFK